MWSVTAKGTPRPPPSQCTAAPSPSSTRRSGAGPWLDGETSSPRSVVSAGPSARVRITERAAPSGVGDHERFVAENGADPVTSAPRRVYDELLAAAGPLAVAHEVLVTLTLDQRRVRVRRGPTLVAAIEALGEELRLLTSRLEGAGMNVGAPLSAPALARALRWRLDPTRAAGVLTDPRSLADLAGLDVAGRLRADGVRNAWTDVRGDGTLPPHLLGRGSPRLEVGRRGWSRCCRTGRRAPSRFTTSLDHPVTAPDRPGYHRLAADEEHR